MNKILMILTSHRLDCLKINLQLLDKSSAWSSFDRVVFLLNGVKGRHLEYIENYISSHPNVHWDTISGPRGRSECISSLENQCCERYPKSVYVKVDEDIFVPDGWAKRMLETYEQFKHEENLALITPLIPNNVMGLYFLLTKCYPEFLAEYKSCFGEEPGTDAHDRVWRDPVVAAWAIQKFINLEESNKTQRLLIEKSGMDPYFRFDEHFSVGCVCWDYRHWKKMGGIPAKDEPEWLAWIIKNNQFNVMDMCLIVQHYSFFVQQDWLDRSNLLEDISEINLNQKSSNVMRLYRRMERITKQVPRIVERRLKR